MARTIKDERQIVMSLPPGRRERPRRYGMWSPYGRSPAVDLWTDRFQFVAPAPARALTVEAIQHAREAIPTPTGGITNG